MFNPQNPFNQPAGPITPNPDEERRKLIQAALAQSLGAPKDNSAALAANEQQAKDLGNNAQLIRSGVIFGDAIMGRKSTGENLGSQMYDEQAKGFLAKNLEMKKTAEEEAKRRADIAKAFGLQDVQDAAQLDRQNKNNADQITRDNNQNQFTKSRDAAGFGYDKALKQMDLDAKTKDTKKADDARSKAEASLRKEIAAQPSVKSFEKLEGEMGRFNSLKGKTGGQADEARILLWNKFLDPESVVREGEFARSRDAQPILAKMFELMPKKIVSGDQLTDAQRKMMDQLMGGFYESARAGAVSTLPRYDKTIADYGYDRARVLPVWATGAVQEQAAVGAAPSASTVRVSNGTETLEIPREDLQDAMKDGYKEVK